MFSAHTHTLTHTHTLSLCVLILLTPPLSKLCPGQLTLCTVPNCATLKGGGLLGGWTNGLKRDCQMVFDESVSLCLSLFLSLSLSLSVPSLIRDPSAVSGGRFSWFLSWHESGWLRYVWRQEAVNPYMCPWSTKAVISNTGIFVAIAKNTLYGSKLSIFLLCQKSLGY